MPFQRSKSWCRAALSLAFCASSALPARAQGDPSAPWSVVDAPKAQRYAGIGHFQIVVINPTTLVGAYAHTGHYSSHLGTYVVRSTDRGGSWERVAKFESPRAASLILDQGTLYLLGINGSGRGGHGCVVAKSSVDGGVTWSGGGASDSFLRGEDTLVSSSSVAAIAHGRVWRTFAHSWIVTCTAQRSGVLVASAQLGTNLLEPTSWRWSSELPLDCLGSQLYTPQVFVVDGDRDLRVSLHDRDGAWKGAFTVRSEGWSLRSERDDGLAKMPRAMLRGAVVRDAVNGKFHGVAAATTRTAPDPGSDVQNNAIVMHRSLDLVNWTEWVAFEETSEPPATFHGFAWAVDGEDLVALGEASFPSTDAKGLPDDAVVFVRIPNFRNRAPSDAPFFRGPLRR